MIPEFSASRTLNPVFILPSVSSSETDGKNRICLIYNPMARGGKARRIRKKLEVLGADCTFLPTDGPGAAVQLATDAINNGFDTIVASGGDGTLNEVVNGIAQAPDGLKRARLGLVPLGTINVFAKELCYPVNLKRAWQTIIRGNEQLIDLGRAAYQQNGKERERYFVQLGGAGLDARAIQLVDWKQKKRILQFAYVIAGLKALMERQPEITCESDHREYKGKLVLVGNGKFYGGMLPVFPFANLADEQLHACVFEDVNVWTMLRFGMGLFSGNTHPPSSVRYLRSQKFKLQSESEVPFELEGDVVGSLPVTLTLAPQRIRVIVP